MIKMPLSIFAFRFTFVRPTFLSLPQKLLVVILTVKNFRDIFELHARVF